MKAEEAKIESIFDKNKSFIIPAYQRPYSWNEENAQQLVEDVFTSMEQGDTEYFIGSLICIQDKKDEYVYEVVDGQQRLTTLILLLSKLQKIIQDSEFQSDLQARIIHKNIFSEVPEEPRLKIRKKEYELFVNHIIRGNNTGLPQKPTYTDSLFINNFKTIGSFLENFDDNTLKKLTRYLLRNVYIVFVKTEDFASSYRLFNVLNNRGTPLTDGDLIKNQLFEHAESNHISSEVVEHKWSQLEEIIGIENIDRFLNINTIANKKDKDRVTPKPLRAYNKRLKEEYNGEVIPLLNDLLASAKNYQSLREDDFEGATRKLIRSLNLLEDEWFPAVLAFFNRSSREECFSQQDIETFLAAFEKVFYQGWIRKLIKSKREMMYFEVLTRINLGHKLNFIIEGINIYADNANFSYHIQGDLYEPSKNKAQMVRAVLLRLEEEAQDDSVEKIYQRISIEHILPQNRKDPYWRERFSEETHAQYVQKLGNLTLLGGSKNSSAQNYSFPKKLESYARHNKKVSFDLTKEICDFDDWTQYHIDKRQDRLVNQCLSLWSVVGKSSST